MAFNWDVTQNWTSALTTGLNSLAAGTSVLSNTITPATTYTGRPFYYDLALALASFSPNATTSLSAYILPAVDNTPTNFAGIESMLPIGTFYIGTGTSVARYSVIRQVFIPPYPHKIGLLSNTGSTTLASSGNTLSYYTYCEA